MKIKIKLLDSLEHTVARLKLEWMICSSGIRADAIGSRLKIPAKLRKKTAITRLELLSRASKNFCMSGAATIRSAVHSKKFLRK